MTLIYHAGQREVQDEANSRPVADILAERLSRRAEQVAAWCAAADLFIFAVAGSDRTLRFTAISGAPPLVQPIDVNQLSLPPLQHLPPGEYRAGAIAIDLEHARRARINGELSVDETGASFLGRESLVNCRKYIAPSTALEAGLHIGPKAVEAVSLHDAGLAAVISGAETAFLASISPDGQPDVSHRGGPNGYLKLDAPAGTLSWTELAGNGMFKSAGNVRATGIVSLLVLDLGSGDAYELSGSARFRMLRRSEVARASGLELHSEDFPAQGEMTLRVQTARRLRGMIRPRIKLATQPKITSCSPFEDQVPR